ncbi:MAG: ankyrin repeat domain-containing protein [Akkermansia sp.]|nr:ankyrin repeat domain-containing protein [Akkermansia sp.]
MGTANSQTNKSSDAENLLALPAGVELGQYRIIRKLGQGGFGITYLAEIIGSGEQVVIKENLPTFCAMRDRTTLQVTATNPNDELQEYAEYLKRFVNEARLLAQLNHPNIVKVLGAFEALGSAYYVMPWVGGRELQKAAPAPAAITEQWLLPILRTLLSTLEYLHGKNIYHRDVKPANILLTEEGTPVLIDFGTARAIISDRSATHVGSPGYSPIEQMRSKGKRGPWTDVYSLGATCYRLITGERPPEANERLAEEEDPLLPLAPRAELRGRFSPAFLATIDKALALRGKNRWQTAAEWLAALPDSSPQTIDGKPISRSVSTACIMMNEAEKENSRPWRQIKEKIVRLLKKWGCALIWAIVSFFLFLLWLSEPTLPFLIISIIFYALFPLIWLRRRMSIAKAMLYIARNITILYILAVILSYSNIYFYTCSRSAAKGYTTSLRFCLSLPGTEYNFTDSLAYAAGNGHAECVRLLLTPPGIDVNKDINLRYNDYVGYDYDGDYYATPLHYAARNGHAECVRHLLAAPGIDVNKPSRSYRNYYRDDYRDDNNPPLYVAVAGGHTECAKLLLAAPDILVNKPNKDGRTPLYIAAENTHTECVKLLLAAPGIDTGMFTPLSLAVIANDSDKLQQLLSEPGVDVNKYAHHGRSLLQWAARNGNAECVRILLATPGIDVNKGSPLRLAEENGHAECARLIRAAGAAE